MAKFKEFCQLASSFADVADFVTVYIEEAHPSDGWAFSNNREIQTHQHLEDRIEAAKILTREHNVTFPVVCDTMANQANFSYGGLYERLYIIQNGKIAYEGGRGPRLYFLSEVEAWINSYKQRTQSSTNQIASVHQ